eukprot:TRINITY_DN19217_c0_g1_i1.p1 TRINITY_DN19217_c0_g1~~TRINITY_DN19217_c0_g1_i1.p1  ORF type:complete len:583 (-),score=166.93 TRINITY_DN19217_c0_g1_i1:308-2020(-)
MSLVFLCRQYEALAEQLRREERSREAAERRGRILAAEEMESAEEAAERRRTSLAAEMSDFDATVAALRATASGASQRAAAQAARAREEAACGESLEHRCARLSSECREATNSFELLQSKVAAQDRETVQAQCESGELQRRVRSAQADHQVSAEDLKISRQRALLVRDERASLEQSLEDVIAQLRASQRDSEMRAQEVQDQRLHLRDAQRARDASEEAVAAAQSDNARRERRLMATRDEVAVSSAQLVEVQRELAAAAHDLRASDAELRIEEEASLELTQATESLEARRATCVEDSIKRRRGLHEEEARMERSRAAAEEVQRACEIARRRLCELNNEERQQSATIEGLRWSRHAEEKATEEARLELRAALRQQDALQADLELHARASELLNSQLQGLRPEVAEADARRRHLEEQLAMRSRDLEEELMRRRLAQDVTYAATTAAAGYPAAAASPAPPRAGRTPSPAPPPALHRTHPGAGTGGPGASGAGPLPPPALGGQGGGRGSWSARGLAQASPRRPALAAASPRRSASPLAARVRRCAEALPASPASPPRSSPMPAPLPRLSPSAPALA